jgi:hypothetical protein
MKVKTPAKATSAAVEYFLYAVIIIQTAIAAFAYKVVGGAAQVWSNVVLYLGFIYVASLVMAFWQLNRLHNNRKKLRTSTVAREAAMQPAVPAAPVVAMEPRPQNTPDIEVGETVAAAQALPVLGLTRGQLAIVLLVFLAALKVFSWALGNVIHR